MGVVESSELLANLALEHVSYSLIYILQLMHCPLALLFTINIAFQKPHIVIDCHIITRLVEGVPGHSASTLWFVFCPRLRNTARG